MEIVHIGFGSSRWKRRVVLGSTYLRTGAPQRCALCNAPFGVEDKHLQCWRGSDQRYYCCRDHAGRMRSPDGAKRHPGEPIPEFADAHSGLRVAH